MFVLGHFLDALAVIIYYALTIYMWVIIARAVLSWVSPDPYNPIVRFIYNLTEPVMHQIRTRIPVNFGGIDISPIIVLFAIIFLQKFVVGTLQGIARSLLLH
jgi:YggT family protein